MLRHAIALFAASVLVPAAAGQTGSLTLGTPPRADAPLQIVASTFNDTMLTVLLVNVSGRAVEEATMGVVLGDRASPAATVTRTGNACRATVPPDGFLVVKEAHVGFDTADFSTFARRGSSRGQQPSASLTFALPAEPSGPIRSRHAAVSTSNWTRYSRTGFRR